jgi:hypothetical protein
VEIPNDDDKKTSFKIPSRIVLGRDWDAIQHPTAGSSIAWYGSG